MKTNIFLSLLLAAFANTLLSQQNKVDSSDYFYNNYQFGEAIRSLESIEQKTEQQELLLAKSYLKNGELFNSRIVFSKLSTIDSNNLYYKTQIATIYLQEEKYDLAKKIYTSLLEIQPTNSFYWKQLGYIEFMNKNLVNSIIAYQNTVKFNNKDLDSYLKLIRLKLKLKSYESAKQDLDSSLTQYPNNIQLLNLNLKLLYNSKKYEEALLVAKQLFILEDSSMSVHKIAGMIGIYSKSYEDAVKHLKIVVEADKDSEIIHYYLGLAYRELGNQKVAIEYFQKAIDLGISNNLSNYYTQLAVTYEEAGDFENSIQAYKIAYKSSKEKILLYHLARNYDLFYKDKSVALNYYEKYLDSRDSANEFYLNYSKHRIQELKVQQHFEIDTLN